MANKQREKQSNELRLVVSYISTNFTLKLKPSSSGYLKGFILLAHRLDRLLHASFQKFARLCKNVKGDTVVMKAEN